MNEREEDRSLVFGRKKEQPNNGEGDAFSLFPTLLYFTLLYFSGIYPMGASFLPIRYITTAGMF